MPATFLYVEVDGRLELSITSVKARMLISYHQFWWYEISIRARIVHSVLKASLPRWAAGLTYHWRFMQN